jgi:hypothetical protein
MSFCRKYGMKIFLSLIFVLLGVNQLLLGIIEGYYMDKYSHVDFKNNCNYAANATIGGCINDLFCGICSLCCLVLLCSNINTVKICYTLFQLHSLKIAYVIISVIFYSTQLECYDFIVTNAPEFWSFIMIHFITGCIVIGISILLFILYSLNIVYLKFKRGRKVFPISLVSTKYEHVQTTEIVNTI